LRTGPFLWVALLPIIIHEGDAVVVIVASIGALRQGNKPMDFPDVISRAIARPQGVTCRYFVVENVEAVAETCFTTPFPLRVTPMVVVMHECIAS